MVKNQVSVRSAINHGFGEVAESESPRRVSKPALYTIIAWARFRTSRCAWRSGGRSRSRRPLRYRLCRRRSCTRHGPTGSPSLQAPQLCTGEAQATRLRRAQLIEYGLAGVALLFAGHAANDLLHLSTGPHPESGNRSPVGHRLKPLHANR